MYPKDLPETPMGYMWLMLLYQKSCRTLRSLFCMLGVQISDDEGEVAQNYGPDGYCSIHKVRPCHAFSFPLSVVSLSNSVKLSWACEQLPNIRSVVKERPEWAPNALQLAKHSVPR